METNAHHHIIQDSVLEVSAWGLAEHFQLLMHAQYAVQIDRRNSCCLQTIQIWDSLGVHARTRPRVFRAETLWLRLIFSCLCEA